MIILDILIKISLSQMILESFRSEKEREGKYVFCPREVWYFAFVVAFVLTSFVALY